MRPLFLTLCAVFAFAGQSVAQDLTWLVDQSPLVSAILLKTLGKAPAFSAKVALTVTNAADSSTTTASGTLASQSGNMRWEARMSDMNSPQLSQNARAVIRQINGENFVLITRSDQRVNHLLLIGAKACLQEPLPDAPVAKAKGAARKELVDGHSCIVEEWTTSSPDGTVNRVAVWRAEELKNLPVQVRIARPEGVFRLRFQNVRFRPLAADLFQVPPGLSTYTSVEDLIQSVMLDKIKRRMGLE